METPNKITFYMTKCESSSALEKSIKENIWAIPVRGHEPQPYKILNEKFGVSFNYD
jgi:hypothetical protein